MRTSVKIFIRIIRWAAMLPFRIIGNVLSGLNRYKLCIRFYILAIKIYPWNYRLYYKRGLALDSLERYHEALEDIERAMEIYNDNPEDWGQGLGSAAILRVVDILPHSGKR